MEGLPDCSETKPNSTDEAPEAPSPKRPRLGDTKRCPACRTHVESEAYHCPTC
jgi:hypothetical protein